MSKKAVFPRAKQHAWVKELLSKPTLDDAVTFCLRSSVLMGLQHGTTKGGWSWAMLRLGQGLSRSANGGTLGFTVFTKGNSKLPFYSWSTLPQYTCPGADECLKYCYSFKAWQYPSALMRQCQNTLLLKFNRRAIVNAWKALKWKKKQEVKTVRLYVDGDIDSIETLVFWWNILKQSPDVIGYGYSKSYDIFIAADRKGIQPPANYVVNRSTGSIHDGTAMAEDYAALPVMRGLFECIDVEGEGKLWPKGFARYQSAEYYKAMKEAGKKAGHDKFILCPGDCGTCGSGKPYCAGMDSQGNRSKGLQGLTILNTIHG